MARRRNLKRDCVKSPVQQIETKVKLATPKVTEVSADTPKAVPVAQPDGTVKFFLVERYSITKKQGRALAPTKTPKACGLRNLKENMAPRGKAGAAPLKQGGKK